MDTRYFASLPVRVVVLAVALLALLPARGALRKHASTGTATDRDRGKKVGQREGHRPGWSEGKKEGWETELPPGWKNWDGAKRQQWKHGLDRAKNVVRKHAEARLNASLRALEMAARKGVPLQDAEKMAKTGLERGLGPFDFDPLGKFVVERAKAGVKGEELSKAIHEELNRRQQERERLREELKEKKELGKQQKRNSFEKRVEGRQKGVSKPRHSDPKRARGKGTRGKQ